MKTILFPLYAIALYAQSAAPSDLSVVSATRAEVRLQWKGTDASATGYRLERQALTSSADFALVGEVVGAATTAADAAIDPYETYRYRVAALRGQERSAASNVVTVGPPPVGFNVPGPLADFPDPAYFGNVVRMALDSNGDPALAYLKDDQLGENNDAGSTLYFLSWDRAGYRWNSPVLVGLSAPKHSSHSEIPFSLAVRGRLAPLPPLLWTTRTCPRCPPSRWRRA